MKEVKIDVVDIFNFRSIILTQFIFDKTWTEITGQNGAGKTNILHAISWCLFGKDLYGRTQFDVMPIGEAVNYTCASVTLEVNKETVVLSRSITPDGKTSTHINGVETKTLRVYDDFVASIFHSLDRFKLFTNPLYFPTLHWKAQRDLFVSFFDTGEDSLLPSEIEKLQQRAKNINKELVTLDLNEPALIAVGQPCPVCGKPIETDIGTMEVTAWMDERHELLKERQKIMRKLDSAETGEANKVRKIADVAEKHFTNLKIKTEEMLKSGDTKETFRLVFKGVPFDELNTAGQLQAGLELTGFFREQLGVSAPTIIDNAERYTDVDFWTIPGQLITARAVEGADLRVTRKGEVDE